MKYPATSRDSGLGWMARRERRACPQRPVRSEQRSQTAQALSPSGLRRFFTFPALLVDYPATAGRVCALLAPWKDEKSAATRHGWVFQQAPKRQSGTKDKVAIQRTATLLPASRGPGRFTGIRLVNFLDNAAPSQAHRGLRRATLPWCRRLEQLHLGQRANNGRFDTSRRNLES